MNLVFISTYIKKLYNLILDELLFDNEIDLKNNDYSISENELDSSFSSEDDLYLNLLIKKNNLENLLYGKNNLCFIFIDENNNCYGMYYPGYIIGKEIYSTDVSFFILSKGIEIIEKKYNSLEFFTELKFSKNKYLLKVGNKNWLFKLYNNYIEFNYNQKLLLDYNKNIMKTSKIIKILVFKCKFN